MAYSAAFFQNMGNYHSFGSMKFAPEMNSTTFLKILEHHPLYLEKHGEKAKLYREVVDTMYPQIEREIFNLNKPFKQLGYPMEGGVTSYFSRSMTKKDLALVKEFMEHKKIDLLNTRAFKDENGKFIISVGSINTDRSEYNQIYKGKVFDIEYGEFKEYLKEVNKYLAKALKFAANEHETQMIKKYIKHFNTGDINDHKDSQRFWI